MCLHLIEIYSRYPGWNMEFHFWVYEDVSMKPCFSVIYCYQIFLQYFVYIVRSLITRVVLDNVLISTDFYRPESFSIFLAILTFFIQIYGQHVRCKSAEISKCVCVCGWGKLGWIHQNLPVNWPSSNRFVKRGVLLLILNDLINIRVTIICRLFCNDYHKFLCTRRTCSLLK